MTKVGNPTLLTTTKALYHFLDHCGDGFLTAVKNTRVGVSLKNLALLLSNGVSLLGRVQPVQSNDVVCGITKVVESVPCTLCEDGHGNNLLAHFSETVGEVVCNVVQIRQGELLEGGGGQLAGPRVEDLDNL